MNLSKIVIGMALSFFLSSNIVLAEGKIPEKIAVAEKLLKEKNNIEKLEKLAKEKKVTITKLGYGRTIEEKALERATESLNGDRIIDAVQYGYLAGKLTESKASAYGLADTLGIQPQQNGRSLNSVKKIKRKENIDTLEDSKLEKSSYPINIDLPIPNYLVDINMLMQYHKKYHKLEKQDPRKQPLYFLASLLNNDINKNARDISDIIDMVEHNYRLANKLFSEKANIEMVEKTQKKLMRINPLLILINKTSKLIKNKLD